jgi:hypothetical protein
MHLDQSRSNPVGESGPTFCAGRKVSGAQKALLWKSLKEDPKCPSRILLEEVARTDEPIPITVRQTNRLRVIWGLNRKKGRPRRIESAKPSVSPGDVIEVTPRLLFVGVHLFEVWIEQQGGLDYVLVLLKQKIEVYKREHPNEDFSLLYHREQTLLLRFKALFFAPLFGIKNLTGFDMQEHPLKTLIGRGYQSSTLSQFLGQLERIDAAEALMPALVPEEAGKIGYVDGHMIAFWTKVSMHKGKITMLGRIMAGSKAVIAHNEEGQALFVEYYPPDIHLSYMIEDYCQKFYAATGIDIFVIDREINSVAMACAFERRGWGLLSMLDSNEYNGLSSFEATEIGKLDDGSRVYSGKWEKPHEDDPRHFVLVEKPEGQVLAYWGTPRVEKSLEPIEWPQVYRQRNEVQENSFKGMIDHGALDINYGRKKIVGPDRHQQRAKEKVEERQEEARQKVEKKENLVRTQQEKVAESEHQGHKKRLEQRQRALVVQEEELKEAKQKQEKLQEQAEALGPPRQRMDRDFRKQRIMTFRTLLLENALVSFIAVLCGKLKENVSLESILRVLFERSGSRVETSSEVIYWVNTEGLSVSYRRMLTEVAEGLSAMDLKWRGKPVYVRLREVPT